MEEPLTHLERILKGKEKMAAIRYSAAELEKMAKQAEQEAAKIERGESVPQTDTDKQEDKKQQIAAQAITLLNAGIDPKVVGGMLAGASPGTAPAIMLGSSDSNTTTDGLIRLIKTVVDIRSEGEKDKIITDLKDRIAKLENKPSAPTETKSFDPVSYAKQSAEAVAVMYSTWKEMGLIKEPQQIAPTGESIEALKEKHRHEEEMTKLQAEETDQKEKRALAGTTLERVGRGAARELRSGQSSIQTMLCAECKKTIYVPPDAGDTLICPSCGTKYARQ